MEKSRNLDLDKLRAIAVLLTMIVHFPKLKAHLPYLDPWSGVDLFFVISGFIVATTFVAHMPMILKDPRTRSLSHHVIYTLSFFCRRFFRLTPAIVAALSFFFASGYLLEGPEFFASFSPAKEVFAIFTYQYNLFVGATGGGKLIWHWSLSAEEQFYLIFPFFMYFVVRPRHRVLIITATLAFITLIVRPFGLFLPRPGPWLTTEQLGAATVLPFYRSDAILYGLLLFTCSSRDWYQLIKPDILRQKPLVAMIISIVLIGVLAYAPGLCHSFNMTMITICVISSILVWLASYNSDIILPSGLKVVDRCLSWVGTRSYGLYLLNVPTNLTFKVLFEKLIPLGYDLPYSIRFPITLLSFGLIAELMYRCIEQPFLQMGGRYSKKIWHLIDHLPFKRSAEPASGAQRVP